MLSYKRILMGMLLALAGLWIGASTTSLAIEPSPKDDAWLPVDGPLGGSVAAVVVSPNFANDQTAFAAVRGHGVYRTTDAGHFWERVTPLEERSGWVILDLAISPNYAADQTVLVLTDIWTYGGNVYRSTDGGDTWQPPDSHPDGMQPGALQLAISPDFTGDVLIYLLSGRGVLHSTDGGQNFIQLDPPWFDSQRVEAVAFSPAYATDQTLLASVWDDGLFRSTDAGITWTPSGSGLPSGVVPQVLALSPHFDADGMALLVSNQDQTIYRSSDGGNNWTATDLTLQRGKQWLTFSPNFAADQLVFAGSQNDGVVYRSDDGGQHWSTFGEGLLGAGSFDLALSPEFGPTGTTFLAHSNGVYQNTAGLWHSSNQGLARLYVSDVDAGPPDAPVLFVGTNFFEEVFSYSSLAYHGNVHTSPTGQVWQPASPRLERVVDVAVSPNYGQDQTVFAATGYLASHGVQGGHLYRTTDGGRSWQQMPEMAFLQSVALSPDYAHDQTVFASSAYPPVAGLHRSTDGGETWTHLKTVYSRILALSPGYASDGIVFTASFENLLRSTDRGDTWTPVFDSEVRALVLSPDFATDGAAYLVSKNSLYRSGDGGLNWQQIPADDLPGPPDVLTFGPVKDLYTSVRNVGVHRSIDGGSHWEPVGRFPADHFISALKWYQDKANTWTLYAGTDDGLWAYQPSETPPGPPIELANGDFEDGFYTLNGVSIANGWATYTAAGNPSFAGERSTVHGGQWAYKLSGYAPFTAGLAQVVGVEPGQTYRVTAYYQLYPPGDGQAFLGVQDGPSPTHWVGDSWPGVWRCLSQEITATSAQLLITLQGSNGLDPNTNVYFDDVSVTPVGTVR
ncbi:MAG: hypothetical protein JXM69_20855 [Anaerolineae bacterium]|nr:hypothetical protein [Anaerolineae bacterium]